MHSITSKSNWWRPAAGSLTFFFCGLIFLHYPGLQNDESLAVSPLYQPIDAIWRVRVFGAEVPIMLMAYLGALKTWICAPLLKLAGPSYLSVRLPALLAGAASVWVFYFLLDTVHGSRAAAIGTVLLATDTMYLLTSCFDWGPVALQHLLSTTALVLFAQFHKTRRLWTLAAASFSLGLAAWDKALLVWLFSGLLAATLIVFPRQLWGSFSNRNVAIAALAFCLGSFPLIAYNVTQHFPTLSASKGFSAAGFSGKRAVLLATWEGAGLFGYVVNEDSAERPRPPGTPLERLSFRIHDAAGTRRYNRLTLFFLACLLTIPFLWRSPARNVALFCLITLVVGWLHMAFTREAGGAVHHTVLLWPIPHLLMAVVLAQISIDWGRAGRFVAIAAVLSIAALNLLVTNQYLYQFARDGAKGSWTDAIYPLSTALGQARVKSAAVIDWGIIDPLDVLNRGQVEFHWEGDPFLPRPDGAQPPDPDAAVLNDPAILWIAHTGGNEQFPGVNAGLSSFAARRGYEKIPVAAYLDRNGRAIFQTFHLVRANAAAPGRPRSSPGICCAQ